MNEEEEDKFLKENPVVFKKFIVKRKFGEGAFGEVYLGQTIEKKEYVALKVEPKKNSKANSSKRSFYFI
jgi:serine/threonine protein kinase